MKMNKQIVKEKIELLKDMVDEYRITRNESIKNDTIALARELKEFMFNKGNYHIESGKVSEILLTLNK